MTAVVTVEDNCDLEPEVVLTSVVSNELDEDPSEGDGNTINDIQDADIGTEDYKISLRAERNGEKSGREYTISYVVIDSSGNTATANDVVIVSIAQN